jgi:hypothetical protein
MDIRVKKTLERIAREELARKLKIQKKENLKKVEETVKKLKKKND